MVTSSKSRPEKKARKKTNNSKPAASAPTPAAKSNGSSPSGSEHLRQLYNSLLKSRLLQRHVQGLADIPAADARFDLAIGDEAVTVGATADLRGGDTIAASHNNLAALIATRVPLGHLLAGGHAHQSCTCPAAATVLAPYLSDDPFSAGTGVALGHKLAKRQNVVVAFCSVEAPSLEQWRDALHIAALQKLPILYVMKSSKSGEASAVADGRLEDFSYYMKDHGFPNISVDGHDVVAVWRVAQESVHRARNGSGPTLMDCRMESSQDPLAHMEHYLRKRGLWDEEWKRRSASEIAREIIAASKTAAGV